MASAFGVPSLSLPIYPSFSACSRLTHKHNYNDHGIQL